MQWPYPFYCTRASASAYRSLVTHAVRGYEATDFLHLSGGPGYVVIVKILLEDGIGTSAAKRNQLR